MATLQTLDRGIKALFLIGSSEDGLTVGELAKELGVDRAIAYRVVSTLEENGLVSRLKQGRLFLGAGILQLEARFLPQLRSLAAIELQALADAAQATAFLSMADGDDGVAIAVAEHSTDFLRVSYRVGSRHPLSRGAAGIAILSGRPAKPGDSEEVRQARADGYSVTHGALQKGAVGVAAPLAPIDRTGRPIECSIGVVAMEDLDVDLAASLVVAHARDLSRALTGGGA
ncbi:IclR family transcriptional regulator [Thalassovita aquimarina]|uniref:Helix-turn-helix domain-containing protein n=1 Tax=Thalassovita aquimarina TaxID=2785917 RepID=A0ABS5HR20_9RHOB|nr:helix-turn-helix domain-containing protein [Thalassovita aquimarina]MBR9651415.1 helix-turn-helix domain-containing protein [Thalassovita aquimarina]